MVKNLPASEGDIRDVSLIPVLGRFPGGGHGNPLQYLCLENPMDRRTWQATVHRVSKSRTQLKQLSTHVLTSKFYQWNCTISTIHFCNIFLILLLFILFYFIFKLYIIVLVLPNIKMNPPQVYILNSTTELCNDTLCLYLYTHICVHENIIFPNNMEHHNAYNQEKQKIYFTVSSNRNSTQY